MKPIKGWDEAPAFTGEFRALPKDKYVCKIMEVVDETVNGGNRRIVIYYDIAEGPYKDYFSGLYKEAKKKMPVSAWTNGRDGISSPISRRQGCRGLKASSLHWSGPIPDLSGTGTRRSLKARFLAACSDMKNIGAMTARSTGQPS